MTPEQKEAVRERLAEIEQANGGRLTPSAVVDDAKKKDSPLHPFFEWDTRKAAKAHWLEQARDLISSVRVKVTTTSTMIKAPFYIRDPSAASHEQGYVSVATLRTRPDDARAALIAEFTRIADLLRRARNMAAALEHSGDIEKLIEGVVGLRQRFLETPPMQQ